MSALSIPFTVALPLGYFAAALAGMQISGQTGNVAALWPASAVAVWALVREPPARWPALLALVALANIAANLLMGSHLLAAAGAAAAGLVEVLIVAATLSRYQGEEPWYCASAWLMRLGVSVTLGSAAAATLGAAWLALLGAAPFGETWPLWFVADLLGLFLFTPLLLSWSEAELRRDMKGRSFWATMLLSGSIAAVTALVFTSNQPVALFLPFPLVLLATVRTGLLGATIAAAALATTATWLTVYGYGPIARLEDLIDRIELVQLYVILALLSSVPVAIVLAQRDRSASNLRIAQFKSEEARREAEHARDQALRSVDQLLTAREEQARSDERLRSALKAGNMGTWELDIEKQDMVWSDLAYEFLGYSVAEVKPSRDAFLARIHPDDRPLVEEAVHAAIRERKPARQEFRTLHPDGTILWCEDQAEISRDVDGRPVRFVGIVRNITEQKLAEAALQASEARYRLLADNTMDMIARADVLGRQLYVSPRSLDLLGYHPEELVGTLTADLVHPDDFPELDRKLCALKRGELRNAVSTFRLRRKDGSWVPVEATYRTILSPEGVPQEVIGITRDISEREQLEAQLRQAQKMEAVGQLTGGIAHDFNNLLTVVLANAEFLADEATDPEAVHGIAQIIIEAAEQGAELTQKLLVFSRRQSLKSERLELNELVDHIVPLLRRTLGDNIELVTDLRCRQAAVADRSLVSSAILNLAVNARDAMPKGGTITIATGEMVVARSQGDLRTGDPAIFLTVRDTGTGMPPDVAARAFEPFFTTKETGRGSGLGLSMVYGVAAESGGHVHLESRPGEGTAVTILLPVAHAAAPAEDRSELLEEVEGGGENVLLVEDEDLVRTSVASQLTTLGYRVATVPTASAAIAHLRRIPVDLLFSDVMLLGDLNGLQLARQAREVQPNLRILLTSGYPEQADPTRTFEGFHLLCKPYRRRQLAAAVRQALSDMPRSGQSTDPQAAHLAG